MRLNTVKNARGSLASLIRKREKNELDDGDFKSLVYGLNVLLGYLKTEADLRIEDRIDELEQLVKGKL